MQRMRALSVAAIALGLASLSSEYINDIPQQLTTDLENEKYGFDFLVALDKQLLQNLS